MTWSKVLELFLAFVLVRQLFILHGVLRSISFLRGQSMPVNKAKEASRCEPFFYVVLPVLREAAGLEACVKHFLRVLDDQLGELVVVTTEREYLDAATKPTAMCAAASASTARSASAAV